MNLYPLEREDIIFLNTAAVANIGQYKGTFIYFEDAKFEKSDTPFEYNIIISVGESNFLISYNDDKEARDTEYEFLMERKRSIDGIRNES